MLTIKTVQAGKEIHIKQWILMVSQKIPAYKSNLQIPKQHIPLLIATWWKRLTILSPIHPPMAI